MGNYNIRSDWQCPICKNKKFSQTEKYYTKFNIFKKTKLVTCSNCSTKSIFPLPFEKDIEEINTNYWQNIQTENQKGREFHYSQALSQIEYLRKFLPGFSKMKILDIGSGRAYIFNVFKSKRIKLNYTAVEVDLNVQEELKNKGLKKIYSSWKSIKEFDYDIVILSHVIEHFVKPIKYLNEIISLIKRNGYVFVEVPNQDDTFKTFFGTHLLVFNKMSVNLLFENLGLNILDTITLGENIKKINKSKVKKFLKRNIPLSRNFYELLNNRIKREKILIIKDNSIEYNNNNNGRWIRLIAQKK